MSIWKWVGCHAQLIVTKSLQAWVDDVQDDRFFASSTLCLVVKIGSSRSKSGSHSEINDGRTKRLVVSNSACDDFDGVRLNLRLARTNLVGKLVHCSAVEVSGDEDHVRDLVVINELEQLSAFSCVAFKAVFTTKRTEVLDRLRHTNELPDDASGLCRKQVRLELSFLSGTKKRAARGESTHDEGTDLGLIVRIRYGCQRSTAEAAGVEHERRGRLALDVVAVEVLVIRCDRIACGTSGDISDWVVVKEALHAVRERLGVVDVGASVAAKASIAGAKGTAREVIGYFMVIKNSKDRSRSTEISECIQTVAG